MAPVLTPREREVLALLCRGVLSDRAIAEALVVNETTAHYHVANLLQKLDCSRRGELIVRAYAEGLDGAA